MPTEAKLGMVPMEGACNGSEGTAKGGRTEAVAMPIEGMARAEAETKAEALPLGAGWRRKQGDANNGVVEKQALLTEAGWKRRRSHCQKTA